MSFSINASEPVQVKPTQTKIVAQCILPPSSSYSTGYVLARAGMNSNGPICVRLVDQYGAALSNYVESFSTSASLLVLPNVRVPSSPSTPHVVCVEVVNKSTIEHSNACVENVLLLE